MPRIKPTSALDHDWEGESDARALMQAQEVQADPARHKKAQKHLKKMQDDHLQKAAAAIAVQKSPADAPQRPEHRKISKAITAMFKKRNR